MTRSGRPAEPEGGPPPRANPWFVGHETAEAELRRAFARGRPAQSWLLAGPRGIGKATLAFRTARLLLARPPATAALPGLFGGGATEDLAAEPVPGADHPVFRRVASGGHGDLFTLEPGFDAKRGVQRTEITVDEVRAVGGFLGATAAEGGWRVVIVDPADAMNRHAANALLKTLEEPPAGAVIFLVSHAPGSLPATVRSRCRRLTLKPLPAATVADLLRRYAPALAEPRIESLARLARGSIGYALELASQDLGGVERQVAAVFRSLPSLDGEALLRLGDSVAGAKRAGGFALAADLVRTWLSSVIRVANGAPPADLLADEGETTARLAAAASLDRWLEVWDKTVRLLARTETANLDARQIICDLFLHVEGVMRR
jgi:DNA polymerase-3 subunit delta'